MLNLSASIVIFATTSQQARRVVTYRLKNADCDIVIDKKKPSSTPSGQSPKTTPLVAVRIIKKKNTRFRLAAATKNYDVFPPFTDRVVPPPVHARQRNVETKKKERKNPRFDDDDTEVDGKSLFFFDAFFTFYTLGRSRVRFTTDKNEIPQTRDRPHPPHKTSPVLHCAYYI